MRFIGFGAAAFILLASVSPAQAKSLSKKEIEVCRWGSDVAKSAQRSKLSGTTLYSARAKLKARKFSEAWERNMAFGITDQTYGSKSRLQPALVKKAYYDGCIQHELARK